MNQNQMIFGNAYLREAAIQATDDTESEGVVEADGVAKVNAPVDDFEIGASANKDILLTILVSTLTTDRSRLVGAFRKTSEGSDVR